MITCVNCSYTQNMDGARFCAQCGTVLTAVAPALRGTQRLATVRSTSSLISRNKHLGKLGRNEVALYIAERDEPLITSVTHETILGRVNRVASITPQPAIDLTAFQAVELGVSRAHAALRRYKDGLALVDLDSTNGTWVNGTRLKSQMPIVLQNGDRVALAKLTLYVYFQ